LEKLTTELSFLIGGRLRICSDSLCSANSLEHVELGISSSEKLNYGSHHSALLIA
jgi:hypothetical protein